MYRVVMDDNKSLRIRNTGYMCIAVILVVSVLFSLVLSVSSCSKKEDPSDSPIVSESDPWFSYDVVVLGEEYDNTGFKAGQYQQNGVESFIAGRIDQQWVYVVSATRNPSTDSDDDPYKCNDIFLELINDNGEVTLKKDLLSDYLEKYPGGYDILMIRNVVQNGDELLFCCFENTLKYDLKTMSFLNGVEETNIVNRGFDEGSDEIMYLSGIWDTEGYRVVVYETSGAINTVMDLYDTEGNRNRIDFRETTQIFDITDVTQYKDGKLIFFAGGGDKGFYILDPSSLESHKATDKDGLPDGTTYLSVASHDEKLYGIDNEGITEINFQKGTAELVFDWNMCNLPMDILSSLKLYEVNNDGYIFIGNDPDSAGSKKIVTLNKETVNPHAGKKILLLSGMERTEDVCCFNDSDGEYFIKIDNRYDQIENSINQLYKNGDPDMDQIVRDEMELHGKISEKMAIDLMNGDGPDLIYGASHYQQLMNQNTLMDLGEMIDDKEFSSEKYFMNLVDGLKIDGELYVMPLEVGVSGIITVNESYKDLNSLSFEQYNDIVHNAHGGKNLIGYDRLSFIESCFPVISDKCIADGKCDFDCEAFRMLLKFAKDNVNDMPVLQKEEWEIKNYVTASEGLASYNGVSQWLYEAAYSKWDHNSAALIPYPSYDDSGLGICASYLPGLSIAQGTSSPEGCWRFISFMASRSPLNREVWRKIQSEDLSHYNDECRYYSDMLGTKDPICGLPVVEADENTIAFFETMLDSCTNVYWDDPAIKIVVYEEVQPFLADQKSLDEIIPIINDRVQKIIDERG